MSQAGWFRAAPPAINATEAIEVAARLYGLNSTARQLYAERDLNFRLSTPDGRHYLLKIANPDNHASAIVFQTRVLRYLAEQVGLTPGHPLTGLLARVLPGLDGQAIQQWQDEHGEWHAVRLFSWLDGRCIPLQVVPPALRNELGRLLAHFDLALSDCDPTGAPTALPWDIARLQALGELQGEWPEFPDGPDGELLRRLARELLARHAHELMPALAELPGQLIHNDLNPDNILFDELPPTQITGLLDLGDVVTGPVVCDLAVALAYQFEVGEDPGERMQPMLRGYEEVRPLSATERELLPDLIACRLLTTLLIQGWRASHQPDAPGEPFATALDAARKLVLFSEYCRGTRLLR